MRLETILSEIILNKNSMNFNKCKALFNKIDNILLSNAKILIKS